MAFLLTVLYVVLTFLSVNDSFPDLAEFRIQLILGILAILATVPSVLSGQVRFNKQAALMAVFTGFVLASWLPHGWLGGSLVALSTFMPLGIVFFLTAFNIRTIRHLQILRFALVVITLYLVGRGLFDYFWSPDDSPFVMIQTEFDITVNRLMALGILADPNAFSQYLLAMLPILFVDARKKGVSYRAFVLIPAGALLLAAIFYSHSRGALIGAAALIGVLAKDKIKSFGGGIAAVLAAVGLMAVGFTGGRPVSVGSGTDRLDIWSDGLGMFKSSPIWGVGFNGFTELSPHTAHNSFLLCVVELGVLGAFLWVGLLVVSFWQMQRVASAPEEESNPNLRAWARAVLFALVAFLVPGFFLSETYAPMLYLLLGMSAAISRMEMERTGKEVLPEGSRWALRTVFACAGSIVLVYAMVRLRAF